MDTRLVLTNCEQHTKAFYEKTMHNTKFNDNDNYLQVVFFIVLKIRYQF